MILFVRGYRVKKSITNVLFLYKYRQSIPLHRNMEGVIMDFDQL